VLNLLILAAEAPARKWGIFVPDDSTIAGLFLALTMGVLVYVMIQRARAGLPILRSAESRDWKLSKKRWAELLRWAARFTSQPTTRT